MTKVTVAITPSPAPGSELEYGQWYSREGKLYVLASTGNGPQLVGPDGSYWSAQSGSKLAAFGTARLGEFKRVQSIEIKATL